MKKIITYSILILLFFSTSLIVLGPIQREFQRRFDILKERLLEDMEELLGRSISYSKISPSIFRYFELHDLVIYKDDEMQDPLIEIQQFRIFYNIFKLDLDNPLSALTEVRVVNSSFRYQQLRDEDLLHFIQSLLSVDGELADSEHFTVPQNLRITGRNITLTMDIGDYSAGISGLFFNMQNISNVWRIAARGRFAFNSISDFFLESFYSDINITANFDHDFTWADARLRLENIYNDYFLSPNLAFFLAYDEGLLTVRKAEDQKPLDFFASFALEDQILNLGITAESFSPHDLIQPGDKLLGHLDWFYVVLSGTLSGTYSFMTNELFYVSDADFFVDIKELPYPLDITFKGQGSLDHVQFEFLDILSPIGQVSFAGDFDIQKFLPSGDLTLQNLKLSEEFTLSTSAEMRVENEKLLVQTELLDFKDFTIPSLDLSLMHNFHEAEFDAAFYFEQPGQIRNSVSVYGFARWQKESFLQIEADFTRVELNRVLKVVDFLDIDYAEGFELTSKLFLATDFSQYSFATTEFLLENRLSAEKLSAEIVGTNREILLNNIQSNLFDQDISADARVSLNASDIALVMSLNWAGLDYSVHAQGYAWENFLVHINEQQQVQVLVADAVHIAGTFADFPLPLFNQVYYVSADLRARVANGLESLSLQSFQINGLWGDASVARGSLALRGNEIHIRQLSYEDRFSHVQGNGVLNLLDSSINGWIQLYSDASDESYAVNLSITDDELLSSIQFTSSPIQRLQLGDLFGNFSGEARIHGSLDNLDFYLSFLMEQGLLGSDEVRIRANMNFVDDVFLFDNTELSYLGVNIQDLSGTINVYSGQFSLLGELISEWNYEALTASLKLDGHAETSQLRLNFSDILRADLDALIRLENIALGSEDFETMSFNITRRLNSLRIDGGPEDSIDFFIDNNGLFTLAVSNSLPVSFLANGTLVDTILNASMDNIEIDLAILQDLIDIPFFQLHEGTATGSLNLRGNFYDAELSGQLLGKNVKASSIILPDGIGPFDAEIIFDEKNIVIFSENVPSGSATLNVNLLLGLDRWVPDGYQLYVETAQNKKLNVEYAILGLKYTGLLEGSFQIDGTMDYSKITSNIQLSNGIVTFAPEVQQEFTENAAYDIIADVTISLGRLIQFMWPDRIGTILSAYAESGEMLKIQYDSIAESMKLLGNIPIRSGEVYFPGRNFYIREGGLRFNEDENSFDPVLSILAELRDISLEGDLVRIYFIIDEKPLSQFQPRFESDPPLSYAEIMALLETEFFSQLGLSGFDLRTALEAGGELGNVYFLRYFENQIKDLLKLDMFSIKTSLFKDVLLDKLFFSNTESDISVYEYLFNTRIIAGQYLSSDVFLQGELLFSQNRSNDYIDATNIDVASVVSLEWRTPLFLMDFRLQPSLQGLEETYRQSGVGFTWKFLY